MSASPDTSSAVVVRKLLPAMFPGLRMGAPKLVLAGREFDTWAAGDVVVKFPKSEEHAAKLEVEVALRDLLVARLGKLVPAIRAVGEPAKGFPFRAVAFERTSGRPGQQPEGPIIRPKPWARTALAREVAAALSALHATPVSKARAAGVRRATPALVEGLDVGEPAIAWARKVAGNAVDAFLVTSIPADAQAPGKPVLCHGDLKGEHVFVSEDATRVVAIVDWADAVIADPAVDLAGLGIWLGPAFIREVAPMCTGPADDGIADRAVFLARAGLLHFCEAVLAGEEHAPKQLLDAQLRAVFSD